MIEPQTGLYVLTSLPTSWSDNKCDVFLRKETNGLVLLSAEILNTLSSSVVLYGWRSGGIQYI